MDRLEGMRIFVAVAEARGFAPAARVLGMSPPAVTRAIAALEERVGARLLRRSTRQVALTEAARASMPTASASSEMSKRPKPRSAVRTSCRRGCCRSPHR